MRRRAVRALAAALGVGLACGMALAQEPAGEAPRFRAVPVADPELGRELVAAYACGVCHTVPGINGARGSVGPDLSRFGQRDFIAGILPNRPDQLALWLQTPQAFVPRGAMPDMGVSAEEAAHMAAYLGTLQGERPPFWAGAAELWRTLVEGPR